MIRRVCCFLALLMVLVTGLVQSTSVSKKVGDVQFVFRRGNTSGTVIDTTDDARIVGYPDGEDTTGNGMYLTYSYSDSFGYWWADSVETDVYDFYICHAAGACSLITSYQNQLVWGTGVGDSMIADSLAFAANVITRAALRNDVIGADELDNTANFLANRFSAVQVLADTIGDKASGIVTLIDDVRGLATAKIATDSIVAHDSSYIYVSAPWKIPAAMAVLDTFIHYSTDGAGTDCVAHTISFPGAEIGDWFWWRFYPGTSIPARGVSTGIPFYFSVACTTADSAIVMLGKGALTVFDYSEGDSVIAILRLGDWLGD